jgi:hypothetical protein
VSNEGGIPLLSKGINILDESMVAVEVRLALSLRERARKAG